MKTTKILIIEDEKPNADRLIRLLLELRPQSEILSVIEGVTSAVEWFTKNSNPDLVMMDVRLADGISFEIFKQVEISCPVIFTTAYDEYAVKAFKHNGVDYLLKPIEKEELQNALERFDTQRQKANLLDPAIESLLNYITPKEYRNRFLLPFRDSFKTVIVSEVAFFSSELNITQAILYSGENEFIPFTLEKLEQQLDPKFFFRANRQYIVHIDAVQRVHNYFNGKLKIELKKNPDVEVIVSREKAPLFKTWLEY